MKKRSPSPATSTAPDPAAAPIAATPSATLEQLQHRLRGLQSQHAQAVANVNAVAGAIQFCELLIAEASAPAATPASQA